MAGLRRALARSNCLEFLRPQKQNKPEAPLLRAGLEGVLVMDGKLWSILHSRGLRSECVCTSCMALASSAQPGSCARDLLCLGHLLVQVFYTRVLLLFILSAFSAFSTEESSVPPSKENPIAHPSGPVQALLEGTHPPPQACPDSCLRFLQCASTSIHGSSLPACRRACSGRLFRHS